MFLLLPSLSRVKADKMATSCSFPQQGHPGWVTVAALRGALPLPTGPMERQVSGVSTSPLHHTCCPDSARDPPKGTSVLCLGSWKNMPSNQGVFAD